AINILISQGFVQKGHGRSARVVKFSEEDVVQIYQVQAALESTAARLVVERQADLTILRDAVAALRDALQGDDLAPIIESALHFHLTLCESSGNPFLTEQFRRLTIPLYAFTLMRAVVQGVSKHPWHNSLALFERMMDALASGDPFFAEHYVLQTIQRFARQACEIWAHELTAPERVTALRRRPPRS
ncbi:MAG: GntR family transcriptional regulator, partial [Bryobacteraceae bacterium]